MEVLRRGFSRTCHSTQGMSLGDKIYIHDIGNFMCNHTWVRTAITRCSTLDIIIVNGSQMKVPSIEHVKNRIKNHQDYDRKFKYEEKDYITPEWVYEKLKKQRYQCNFCHKPVDDYYSVDRINNNKPHIKYNCVISCQKCQSMSCHR